MRLKKTYRTIWFIFLFLFGLAYPWQGHTQDIGLSVVANTSGVPDELTAEEMKKIFLGQQRTWGNNKYIKLALLKPDTKVGAAVSQKLYGMTPDELKKYWLVMAFQGRAKTPKFFDTVSDLKAYVASTAGCIGVIEYASEENLKFVPIDNKDFF